MADKSPIVNEDLESPASDASLVPIISPDELLKLQTHLNASLQSTLQIQAASKTLFENLTAASKLMKASSEAAAAATPPRGASETESGSSDAENVKATSKLLQLIKRRRLEEVD